jgi:hypothetical protein
LATLGQLSRQSRILSPSASPTQGGVTVGERVVVGDKVAVDESVGVGEAVAVFTAGGGAEGGVVGEDDFLQDRPRPIRARIDNNVRARRMEASRHLIGVIGAVRTRMGAG